MSERARGTVLNLHAFGATIRLDSGRIASAPSADVQANRAAYQRALTGHKDLQFALSAHGRHATVTLIPQLYEEAFENQIAEYIKETQEWETPDAAPAHERHFLRKKKRAALFESRHSTDR